MGRSIGANPDRLAENPAGRGRFDLTPCPLPPPGFSRSRLGVYAD